MGYQTGVEEVEEVEQWKDVEQTLTFRFEYNIFIIILL